MENRINMLLNPKTNGPEITFILTELLQVKITAGTLKKNLEEHPDYPSLLSISDVLSNYGIENLSIRLNPDKLSDVPIPFITQVKSRKNEMELFTVVKDFNNGGVLYFDPEKHLWDVLKEQEFLTRTSGVILLAEALEDAGEKEYRKNNKTEIQQQVSRNVMVFWLPVIMLISAVSVLSFAGIHALLPIFFSLLTLAGCFAGVLLMYYELDEHNPVLQQICGITKKINCGAVLQSKGSKIAGISWSAIGFSYFTGMLIMQIFGGLVNPNTLFACAWLNVLAIPYVFYSVYYQWRIARQWCILCLFVQSLLVLQLATAVAGNWHILLLSNMISGQWGAQVFTAFAIPFMTVMILMPALLKAKERGYIFTELQRLKHNPQIFNALLEKQEIVSSPPAGLGILLGNPQAPYKIIKVCNPYCGPCAQAHIPMEELLDNNPDVQIQILFTASNHERDTKTPPVKHLLAIAEKNNQHMTKQALDDWYLAEHKDYASFATKYPMNGELALQNDKIEAMNTWCLEAGIMFTPTFFISISEKGEPSNYHKLPELYNVADLKYFLAV
jgi:uncharacterized membrane protein